MATEVIIRDITDPVTGAVLVPNAVFKRTYDEQLIGIEGKISEVSEELFRINTFRSRNDDINVFVSSGPNGPVLIYQIPALPITAHYNVKCLPDNETECALHVTVDTTKPVSTNYARHPDYDFWLLIQTKRVDQCFLFVRNKRRMVLVQPGLPNVWEGGRVCLGQNVTDAVSRNPWNMQDNYMLWEASAYNNHLINADTNVLTDFWMFSPDGKWVPNVNAQPRSANFPEGLSHIRALIFKS